MKHFYPSSPCWLAGLPIREANDDGKYYIFEKPERLIIADIAPKAEMRWLSLQQRRYGLRFR